MAVREAIAWQKEIDAALDEARKSQRPVFVDFNAAPM